jgi:hypothetical protein
MDWYIIMAWGSIAIILIYSFRRFRLLKYILKFFIVYAVLIHPYQAQDEPPTLDPIDYPPPDQPLTFPAQLPRASVSIQDAIDEVTCQLNHRLFLGNNSTNGLNFTQNIAARGGMDNVTQFA